MCVCVCVCVRSCVCVCVCVCSTRFKLMYGEMGVCYILNKMHGEMGIGDKWQNVVFVNKEGTILFNDALNTFFYGYMASDIW